MVGNLAAFSNGGFRFIFGYLYDKHKFYLVYNYMLFGNVVVCLLITLMRDSQLVFTLLVVSAAAIEGAHFSIFAPFTIESFGIKYGP